jgi:NADH-quinone oxidoreductase subunit F
MIAARIRAAKRNWHRLIAGDTPVLYLGCATCGLAAGAGDLLTALPGELARLGIHARIVPVGCLGLCHAEPLLEIQAPGMPRVCYGRVTVKSLPGILRAHLRKHKPSPAFALGTTGEKPIAGIPRLHDLPFMKSQVRVVLRNCGIINPENVDHYLARGGYEGFIRAMNMQPEDVISEVVSSGLRGRGGGGFPTGKKWLLCRQAPGTPKYLVCNADEGDPGAFMNRSLLEGDPHSVLEGMCIAAYAIGATQGYLYVRAEYPLAIQRLKVALGDLRRLGILGDRVMGAGFSFDLCIKEGAGAFVCGEETALLASLEGNRGAPRPRPPFPAAEGLWGRPTNINNVETYACAAAVLRDGSASFAALGTAGSRGTKTFALTGKVARTGLIEVPMGLPLRRVVEEIGGGIAGGADFKAVQTGGPSGGCLPAKLADLPIEYETLSQAGSIMGSGGLVILDGSTCMVDLARYFLTFTQNESCGKCTPCRLGTQRMLAILERICAGQGRPGDIESLEELGSAIKDTSLCGLGQTAPNPVITTLRYFRNEYEEHISRQHCRAAVCAPMVEAPCHHTCPAGVKAHRYVREISRGNFKNAYLVVRESMPLPTVCGTVCFHPCEARCRRGQMDQAIAIRVLKGAAVRYGAKAEKDIPPPAPRTSKQVAVVGSGPAGLTAAYYLSRVKGHNVTIFEELPIAGGMLHAGIPRYRLSAKDLEHDLDIVRSAGVRIKTRARVKSVEALKQKGFDAIFLALGAQAAWGLDVEGGQLTGVMDCIDFLRRVAAGKPPVLGRRVGVVGGGNTAIDAARTALRLGVGQVTVLYRRSRDEMPANGAEIEDALAEGVKLEALTIPKVVRRSPGGLIVTCQRMQLGNADDSGRRRPEPIEGSEHDLVLDALLSAIGQFPAIPAKLGVEVDAKSGCIAVHPDAFATSVEGVFAGGDAVSGPASVVQAIAHGRHAARAIDRYLGGDGDIHETLAPPEDIEGLPELAVESGARARPKLAFAPVSRRVRGFERVERGYSRKAAIEEASRCLRCDLENGKTISATKDRKRN